MRDLIRAPLRVARAALVEIVAAAVARFPSLEPWFVRTGRAMARRSRFGGALYWIAQEALMRRLRLSGRRYREITVRHLTLHVDVTDMSGRFGFFYSTPYEKAVVDAVVTALKPGDVFIDVGAHLGYFSTIAARLVGASGRVVAFEPHQGSRAELGLMAARNQVETIIEVVPLAVAERVADFPLYTTEAGLAFATLDPELSPVRAHAVFRQAAVAHATSLDAWLSARPDLASLVRCIKIDVQGSESRVLAGMVRTLLPPGVTIICETSIGTEADVMLERAGFRRHRIERGSQARANFLYVRPDRFPG